MSESFCDYKLQNDECVHHKDFTKINRLDNLQLMIKKEHNKLHNSGENHPVFGKHHSEKLKN